MARRSGCEPGRRHDRCGRISVDYSIFVSKLETVCNLLVQEVLELLPADAAHLQHPEITNDVIPDAILRCGSRRFLPLALTERQINAG